MKFLGEYNMVTLRRDYNKCRISDIQPNTNDNDHWYTFWPPDLKISVYWLYGLLAAVS